MIQEEYNRCFMALVSCCSVVLACWLLSWWNWISTRRTTHNEIKMTPSSDLQKFRLLVLQSVRMNFPAEVPWNVPLMGMPWHLSDNLSKYSCFSRRLFASAQLWRISFTIVRKLHYGMCKIFVTAATKRISVRMAANSYRSWYEYFRMTGVNVRGAVELRYWRNFVRELHRNCHIFREYEVLKFWRCFRILRRYGNYLRPAMAWFLLKSLKEKGYISAEM